MENIKFGTDGWRSVIADGFTVGNVARLARASARWLINKEKDREPSVVIGYDTRFGGVMFAETVAKIFALTGVKVFLSDRFVSTPMVSYGVINKKTSLGVIITASHNPYNYNGFKIKGYYGGPLLEPELRNIENLVPEVNEIHLESLNLKEYIEKGLVEYVNLEEAYIGHIKDNFSLDKIVNSQFTFAFNAMYGAGQNVLRNLLPKTKWINCEFDYSFGGVPPEPVAGNLEDFSSYVRRAKDIDCGLAVDGDADRVALIDGYGNYIDSHHIMLLLIHYLHKYKGYTGKVVTGFSSTARIEKLCRHYGLEVQRVKIGFKEVCNVMLREKVLLGGEESGGIAVLSHIPDRDGIWMGLLVWQFMAETGKTLDRLIKEVYSITGSFAYERLDLSLGKNGRASVIERCKDGYFTNVGNREVKRVEDIDGYKYIFNDDEWLMVRVSGTEPVLRAYAESCSREEALEILRDAREMIMKIQ